MLMYILIAHLFFVTFSNFLYASQPASLQEVAANNAERKQANQSNNSDNPFESVAESSKNQNEHADHNGFSGSDSERKGNSESSDSEQDEEQDLLKQLHHECSDNQQAFQDKVRKAIHKHEKWRCRAITNEQINNAVGGGNGFWAYDKLRGQVAHEVRPLIPVIYIKQYKHFFPGMYRELGKQEVLRQLQKTLIESLLDDDAREIARKELMPRIDAARQLAREKEEERMMKEEAPLPKRKLYRKNSCVIL
jgi:hypothetical protein